jgi:hypothetical protein
LRSIEAEFRYYGANREAIFTIRSLAVRFACDLGHPLSADDATSTASWSSASTFAQ